MTSKLIRHLGGTSASPTHLLDEFAKAALTGLTADPNRTAPFGDLVDPCYDIAAAMVRARLRMIQALAVESGFIAIEPGQPIPLPAQTPIEVVLTGGTVLRCYVLSYGQTGHEILAYRDLSMPMAEGA